MTGDPRTVDDRLRSLEDWQAILDTLHRYVQSIDHGPAEDWADCFTPDGAYEATFPNGVAVRIEGTDALRDFADKHPRPPVAHHKHLVLAPIVAVTGDMATASSVVGRMSDGARGPQIDVYGRCDDDLVRSPDGRWRFTRRLCRIDAAAPDFRSAAEVPATRSTDGS